ncbi:MAG: HAMP domain-containing sensor histidine kinase [Bacteroidales bacterium]|nr:HAMP domain-containing sensor histidine kinase [Bacteroidales bacterium]
MIRKALTLSIIVIFSLLVVQSVWLYKVIVNERAEFRSNSENSLLSSLTLELDKRVNKSSLKNKVNIEFFDKKDKNQNTGSDFSQRLIIEYDSPGNNTSLKLSMDQVFQDLLKDVNPLNLDTLKKIFSADLHSNNIDANFILTYINKEADIIQSTESKNGFLTSTYSFFTIELPLNASNSLLLNARIYYPIFVYKGDFMLIGFASLILLIFIVVAIVLQFKMLSRQITLAQLRENLTSFFTHELRSPLQSALSSIEMAEMYSDKKEVDSFLELSRNKVVYINRLIEKLLDINKLEKNKVNLIMERFPLKEVIAHYLDNYFSRKDKSIEIEALFDPSLMVYGDKIHISNAIGNLIENAVKYSGDSVNIKIYTKENSLDLTIIVEDNGIGIPISDQKRIFERFYRVNSSEHSAKGKGFGLGLNYVQWVAITHKGVVMVESEPGKGSKFMFTIKK